MENGPEELLDQVQFCMPVAQEYEGVRVGVERIFANFSGAPVLLFWLMAPFLLIFSLFRVMAMRTSKIPQWPEEVEKMSYIEPGDPFAIEGDRQGHSVAVYPTTANAAGICQGDL